MPTEYFCDAGGQLNLWQRRRNGCAHIVSEYYTVAPNSALSVATLPLDCLSAQDRAAQLIKGCNLFSAEPWRRKQRPGRFKHSHVNSFALVRSARPDFFLHICRCSSSLSVRGSSTAARIGPCLIAEYEARLDGCRETGVVLCM